MSDVLLTLDLATKTGFALWQPGSAPRLGTYTIPIFGGDNGRSFKKFADWLVPFMKTAGVTVVMYEAAYVKYAGKDQFNRTSKEAAAMLFGLNGLVEYLCCDNGIRYFQCEVSQWRSHFLGMNPNRGDAHQWTKEECLAKGITFRNQDEADAFGMMDLMAHKLGLEPDWPKGRLRGTMFDKRRAAE